MVRPIANHGSIRGHYTIIHICNMKMCSLNLERKGRWKYISLASISPEISSKFKLRLPGTLGNDAAWQGRADTLRHMLSLRQVVLSNKETATKLPSISQPEAEKA